MFLARLIVPLGILTFTMVLISFLSGWGVLSLEPERHKLVLLLTLICATVHGGIVLYFQLLF
jgi:hypothetical protein